MQATYAKDGGVIDYTPSAAVDAGDVVAVGSMIGFAPSPIAANTPGVLCVSGVADVVKANEQITAGAAVYWDADGNPYGGTAGTGALTTTSTANTFVGWALATAGATAATVRVLWAGPFATTNTVHNALTAALTDPGAAGAIPVTDSGYCPLVTAAAEARSLAAPTYAGQMLLLEMKTDGGDCTLTCATGLNQAGNTQAVFDDAGDTLLLVAVYVGANLRWRVVVNDGCTLSTP